MTGLSVLLRLPRREWAEAVIVDLAGEGCAAELLPGPDREGCWTLLVTGPAAQVRQIRGAASGHGVEFCWNRFLNA